MKSTSKLLSCAVALVLAACSNDQKGSLANISPPVDAYTQAKADALLEDTTVSGQFKTFTLGGGSVQVRSQVKGMTLYMKNETDTTVDLEIEVVEQKNNNCVDFKFARNSVLKSDLQNKWTSINGLGRIRCVVDSCSHALLMIEQSRTITSGNPAAAGQTATVSSSVPVILGFYRDLDHIPMTALEINSDLFDTYLKTSNIKDGKAICSVNVSGAGSVVPPTIDNGGGGTQVPMPINLNGL